MASAQEYSEIHEKIITIERDLDLFEKKISSIYFWERIRGKIFKEIRLELIDGRNITEYKSKKSIKNYYQVSYRTISNLLSKNPFWDNNANILCYGISRRKKVDNYWWDIYFDPILDESKLEYIYIENPGSNGHKKPPKTGNIKYIDLIEYLPKYINRSGFNSISLSNSEKTLLDNVENRISEVFDIDIRLEYSIKKIIKSRKVKLPIFKKLIKSVDPTLVIIVKSGRDLFIEACQDLSVPIVELQHGVIDKYHPHYSFPGDKHTRRLSPNYLFTFGEYWDKVTEYPISQDKIKSVGFPFLEEQAKKISKNTGDHLVFISQPFASEMLSEYAVELAENSRSRIIYKLHPNEEESWQEIYPNLKDSEVTVVGQEGPSLYEVFSKSHSQVGINSTALIEGIYFGLDTFLLNHPMSHSISEINDVSVVDSVNELNNQIDPTNKKSTVDESIFKPNAKENIYNELNDIMNNM